jgi:aryl-alcohol dehydrogenase (NADP+)
LEEEESRPFLKRALELGINFFDTADMYSVGVSEEIVGRALRDFAGGRDRVVIATKVYQPMGDNPNLRGLSRKHIFHSIDDSLRRLGTDYVDLYQIHRFDYSTPIEETIAALDDVVRAGKVRYVGASAMFAWQFAKMLYTADRLGRARFVSMQNHYNVVYREEDREMLPLCREEGIGVIPFSPLARGFVTGKSETVRSQTDQLTKKYYVDSDNAVVEAISAVAKARGVSNAQVA